MTDEEFKKEIARLRRRLELLKLARSGSAEIRRVKVRQYKVRAHVVRAHTRVYYRKRT